MRIEGALCCHAYPTLHVYQERQQSRIAAIYVGTLPPIGTPEDLGLMRMPLAIVAQSGVVEVRTEAVHRSQWDQTGFCVAFTLEAESEPEVFRILSMMDITATHRPISDGKCFNYPLISTKSSIKAHEDVHRSCGVCLTHPLANQTTSMIRSHHV